MKNAIKWFGIIALVAVIGFSMTACSSEDDEPNGNDDGGQALPAASGSNVLSGKIYYEDWDKITFSATAAGDTQGTYVRGYPDNGTYASGVKFRYQDIETGSYTWNEEAKTVTLKPEKLKVVVGRVSSSSDGTIEIDHDDGPLVDRTAYRSYLQAMINEFKQQYGQAGVDQLLSATGFSSVSAYLNYMVNETIGNKTNIYSFSDDGTALFLEQALPANKGANEFSGQTYYGLTWDDDQQKEVKDTRQVYVFTASGYTFTDSRYGTQTKTGSYAYDSSQKRVWLSKSTINGKNRTAYYTAQTAYSGHHLADDNAYRAAETNRAFSYYAGGDRYDSTKKTIESRGAAESEPAPPPEQEEE